MMRSTRMILSCIVFLLVASSIVFALTSATIVTDTRAPTCTSSGGRYCKDLYVEADAESAVRYTVNDIKAGNYTVSFMYKLQSGKFEFNITPAFGVAPVTLADTTWKRFSKSFEIADDQPIVVLRFKAKDAQAKFWLDEIQMTLSPEPTIFNNFKYETGCCPLDYCWTGDSCVHAKFYERNVSMPPLGVNLAGDLSSPATFLTAPSGYRCINGTWKFSRVKFTPLYDKAGYCPDDDQCYNGDGAGTVEKACTESGDFIDYTTDDAKKYGNFYCYKGNWTTRTKEIALQMLNMTSSRDTYTLFCDNYNRALNSDVLKAYYRDYVGDNIVNILNSNLANEFCVLDLDGKVIVGVSLNKEINETSASSGCVDGGVRCWNPGVCREGTHCLASPTDDEISSPKSFLQVMKGSDKNDYCDAVIGETDGAYYACAGTDVYYNAKLKNVIFTKMHALPLPDGRQSVPLTSPVNFIDRIIESIKSVFRNLLNIAGLANPQTDAAYKSQLDFIARAGSFNKIYLSFSPVGPVSGEPRTINAVRETRASIQYDGSVSIKTFISAEYYDYQTDICNFFYIHNYPFLREQISKQPGIQCTPVILDEDNWMYSVYVEQPFFAEIEDTTDIRSEQVWLGDSDSFWNDITAAIRTQSPPNREESSPPVPTFTATPPTPVVGTVINFSLTLPAEQERNLIARTWDFGDGEKASSAYNITTFHNYTEARETGGYAVSVLVMDRNFRIRRSDVQYIVVDVAPQIGILPQPQSIFNKAGGSIAVEFTITGGHHPYNLFVDWGDGSTTDVLDSTVLLSLVHTYSFEEGDTLNKYLVSVRAIDRDGVEFFNSDEVAVEKSGEAPSLVIPAEGITRVTGVVVPPTGPGAIGDIGRGGMP